MDEVGDHNLDFINDDDIQDNDYFQNDLNLECQQTLDNLNADPSENINDFRQRRKEFVRSTQFMNFQTNSLIVDYGEPIDISKLDNFGKELINLGIEVRILRNNEQIFFIENRNLNEIVNQINRIFIDINNLEKFKRLLQDFLNEDKVNFYCLTAAMQSNLGVQDTLLKAFLLSKPFQSFAFEILIEQIDQIGRLTKKDNDLEELGQKCIAHLRYIDQIYDSKYLFKLIFEKQLLTWVSPLRENFIEILPEIIVDQNVHYDVLVQLYTFAIEEGIRNKIYLRKSIFKTMSFFVTDDPRIDNLQIKLLGRIMSFEPIVILEIIKFVLNLACQNGNKIFREFLIQLRKNLNISNLKKQPGDNSIETIDEIVAKIFETIASYVRVNVIKALKDFHFCLTLDLRTVLPKTRKENNNELNENVDVDKIFNLEENQNIEESVSINNSEEKETDELAKQQNVKKNLSLFDVFMIFTIQNVRSDPKIAVSIFKSQISNGNSRENDLFDNVQKVLNFKKFDLMFLSSIKQIAYSLISSDVEVSKLGAFILKQLFINLSHTRQVILEQILIHLNEIDYEATLCLDILSDIIKHDSKLLFPYINEITNSLDKLHLLKSKNCQKLFYIISTLCLQWGKEKNQQVTTVIIENKILKTKINEFLDSRVNQEKVWGVTGILMQIKAYLDFIKSEEISVTNKRAFTEKKIKLENCIKSLLDLLHNKLKENCVVRAEFFYQLGQLIGTNGIPKSKVLCDYGFTIYQQFRERFYKKQKNLGDNLFLSQLESTRFINEDSNLWLNTTELLFSYNYGIDTVNSSIVEVVPILLMLKEFAKYENSFDNQPQNLMEMSHLYSNFFFVLESNIDFHLKANSEAAEIENNIVSKCHVLYFTIEYIRTILNMFCGCKSEEVPLDDWLLKKFNLLLECQSQLIQSIKLIKDYTLPNFSHLHSFTIKVQFREKTEVQKIRQRMQMMNSITETTTAAIQAARKKKIVQTNQKKSKKIKEEVLDNENLGINDNDNNACNQSFDNAFFDSNLTNQIETNPMATATSTRTQRLLSDAAGNIVAVENEESFNSNSVYCDTNQSITIHDSIGVDKGSIPVRLLNKHLQTVLKTTTITVEQLLFYFTPLNLVALGRLLELIKLKRRQTILLIENLLLIIKKILPLASKKKVPIGFGKISISNMLLQDAIINQGYTNEQNWTILLKILPIFFDILNSCALNFRQNTIQSVPNINEDLYQEFANIMQFTLQIFCHIFQCKDIQENSSIETNFSNNYRYSVIKILCEKINQHNLSNEPLNNETTMVSEMEISEMLKNDCQITFDQKECLVDFFIEIGYLVPKIASANTITQLLKCFCYNLSESYLLKIYSLSLFFLSKNWIDEELNAVFQKNYVEILDNYLNIRVDLERLNAIHWLIVNQLNDILEEQSRRAKCQNEPTNERLELVKIYSEIHFPAFNKKFFSSLHKILFIHLNNFTSKFLCSETAKKLSTLKLVELWRMVAQSFFYLVINIRVKELRSLLFLQNCVREGRKFLTLFCAKNCSFKLVLDKNKVGRFTQEICFIIRQIQLGNRLIQEISTYAKAVKFTAILKMLPDLRATSELFLREIHSALVSAGLEDAMKIGFLRPRNIDGQNINTEADALGAAKKKQSQNRKRKTNNTAQNVKTEIVEFDENNENNENCIPVNN